MFSLGIFRPEDYRPESSSPADRLRRVLTGNRISYRLLRTNSVAVFEAIMRGLRLNSGVYRTTFHGRFSNVDPVINDLLRNRFSRETPLSVHDWAASDCLTSAEWAASLLDSFPNAILTASDLTLFLVDVTLPDGTAFVVERDGGLLQYISPPFVVDLNPASASAQLLTRMLVQHARRKASAIGVIPEEGLVSNEIELVLPRAIFRKLPVVHPQAVLLASQDARFSVRSHSVFTKLAEPADVIRSMNIYNKSYFDQPRLIEGGRTVWASLKPGGWWIVGRTWREDPPASNVSVLEKTPSGFRLVDRHGEGSEIEALILAENQFD